MRSAKLVLLGDAGAGKTSLLQRTMYDTFAPYREPTIGAAYASKIVSEDLKLEMWDTAGQERYRALAPMYTRGADLAWLVVEADASDVDVQLERWRRIAETSGTEVFCVMSKVDGGADQCHELHVRITDEPIYFTSAKTGFGCDDLLERSVAFLQTVAHEEAPLPTFRITPKRRQGGCCNN